MTASAADGTRRTRQARLAGPSAALDPRVNAWRADLADADLAGRVIAPHYATGAPMRCGVASAMLRPRPDGSAVAVSELLFGETFTVFDVAGGWAWGQCGHDRYVGWMPASALHATGPEPTHRIAAAAAPLFAEPDIKSAVVGSLPMNARVGGTASDGFVSTELGWLHGRHVALLASALAADPVALALRFAGVPYVWGGRTHAGIDCSGLTQAASMACGIACPRDSDQQRDGVGKDVDADDRRRGDLVFFPGHVGILADRDTLVHANAFWMETVAEPLVEVLKRIPLTGVRRLPVAIVPAALSTTCRLTGRSL